MSRSRKKIPIFGNLDAKSEKIDKRKANRRIRYINKRILVCHEYDYVCFEYYKKSNYYNIWSFAKDGKKYWREHPEEDIYNTYFWIGSNYMSKKYIEKLLRK